MKPRVFVLPLLGLACILGIFMFRGALIRHPGNVEPHPALNPSTENLDPAAGSTNRSAGSVGPEVGAGDSAANRSEAGLTLLKTVLRRHRESMENRRGRDHRGSQIGYWAAIRFDEARLWALSYPEDALTWGAGSIDNGNLDLVERRVAVFVLGVLAQKGMKQAELTLMKACGLLDHPLIEEALLALARADQKGSHRDLYQFQARRGSPAALFALSQWWDPESQKLCLELQAKTGEDPGPSSSARNQTRETLERLRILGDPQWHGEILRILEAPPGERNDRLVVWAMTIAAQGGIPEALPVLRKRLEEAEARMIKLHDQIPNAKAPAFNVSFRRSFSLTEASYDDLLVGYHTLGGTLNDLERIRLTGLGYLGDPATNLSLLLSEEK